MAKQRTLRLWHRRLGLTAAAFVLVLSVTGLMLNHADRLQLNEIKIDTGWVLDWYGLAGVSEDSRTFRVGAEAVSWAEGWVFWNEQPLVGGVAPLRGGVQLNDMVGLAAPREILLLTRDGQLIERFLPSTFGTDIEQLGITDGRGAIVSAGEGLFSSGPDGSLWTALPKTALVVDWSAPERVPDQLASSLNQHLRGQGLPLYRIILDLHSGHFFSQAGVWFMDAAAVLLILLSLTGVWIWWPRP